ncbi:hypothetical protein DO97_04340 [Neosynechococcus sphagnicola sy1]|uniref:Transketolase n=1 Tax=Neosynechococcus sphagnicola sy1 TaxID=1497020 RepID=A0A098TKW2_9CYAN|nr:hypothetical protein [Neosynechococcus sphagnicola]KGF72926.1 hypothetical protein DO97_04340 [Neosynechococcus sphagnicola sy1]
MPRFTRRSKFFGSLLLSLLVVPPVWAHEVEVAGEVAATFHIEPNDQPQAGVPAKAWFALTRRGGQVIPLSQCNCQLAVYPIPHVEGKTPPLMQPLLRALNIGQYQGIPGTLITFPKAGIYELELTGTAKSGVSFKPFTLSFQVTVTK